MKDRAAGVILAVVVFGVFAAALLGIGWQFYVDFRSPEIGGACEPERALACSRFGTTIFVCERNPDLGNQLAWAVDRGCEPGICRDGTCVPR